jgi:hypothetical protein
MAPETVIQRLESATEPSRDLDADVLWEIFPEARKRTFGTDRYISTMTAAAGECAFTPLADRHDCPRYTSSLDDAMTLLGPPGYPLWTVTLHGRSHGQHGMTWTAEVTVPSSEFRGFSSAEPALALCAAALRARVGR